MINELSPEKLRNEFDTSILDCDTTESLEQLKGIIGQDRALKALNFGLYITNNGFNVYVAGAPGTGKETAVKNFLNELAKSRPVPNDWCYVNNFENTHEPKVIKLPPGKGKTFQKDVKHIIDEARRILPEAFQSEDYASKRDETVKALDEEKKKLINELNERTQKEGFSIQKTPIGLFIVPVIDGKPMNDEEFMSLDEKERKSIEKKREELKVDLRNTMRQVSELDEKRKEEIEKLNRQVARFAIGHLVDITQEKYKDSPDVVTYLEDIERNILDNISQFLEHKGPSTQIPNQLIKDIQFRKYEVNVIIDNSANLGGPVVIEHNPTYHNLFGRIEKEAQFGVLSTDFTMIRPGSLHKANGGYLVIPVDELLRNVFSYDSMKRALMNGEIVIEDLAERMGFISTKGLRPEPIPLNVKVVLLGSPYIYHLAYNLDKDFRELFKVKADFDTTMDRAEENIKSYSSFICTVCQKEGLKHLDKSAISKIIEFSSRLAEDQEKLSTKFGDVADIIREANFYATEEKSKYINSSHIMKAIEEKIYRSNLIQEKIKEMIERGHILIDTDGEVIGQVNGLSVIELGDFSFGRPSRVTASVGVGSEGIVDIERESKLGGKIHTKGVMILSGYLAEKYSHDKPLSLSARLVFEQSYGGVEGDSASSTELYSIISALSCLPVKAGIAVTGSVNQKGEVQSIGGVNQKIEGFFEVCKVKELNGNQGVIIPKSNIQNLMLKEEVVKAVEEGKFHIYPVETIDEGIEVLTGVEAGKRKKDRTFIKNSVNDFVDIRLKEMAEKLTKFKAPRVKKKKKRKK
jgi:lon-related putative ATP-dependent protease